MQYRKRNGVSGAVKILRYEYLLLDDVCIAVQPYRISVRATAGSAPTTLHSPGQKAATLFIIGRSLRLHA